MLGVSPTCSFAFILKASIRRHSLPCERQVLGRCLGHRDTEHQSPLKLTYTPSCMVIGIVQPYKKTPAALPPSPYRLANRPLYVSTHNKYPLHLARSHSRDVSSRSIAMATTQVEFISVDPGNLTNAHHDDRRKVRIQVMKDFRRKERERQGELTFSSSSIKPASE